MSTYRSLQRTEAETRHALLDVQSYDVRLDLASDEATFRSVTTVTFDSRGGETWLDLKPEAVHDIRLNGDAIEPDLLDRGRLPLTTIAGRNEVTVDATMRFRNDGEGLHRSVDPADGRHYVYGMSFMDAAPSIFACFDQPDLKAPFTFHVTAPQDWTVIGNSPAEQVEPGVWELEPTPPLSTYFVTLVAGPYHVVRDQHDGIPLGLSARQSLAKDLDQDAEELLTVTRQCFDEFHRLFGIRYPFGDYHQAFVPEFNAGAMENPGCVTFRDPLVFSSRVTRGLHIVRAITVAHEMAHQWVGTIGTTRWWDDLWLNESFAEYMGNRVTADVTEFSDAWTHNAHARRQWGLTADQRPSTHPVAGNGADDASSALQDFDGISYAKGSSVLKQLNTALGDEVFFAGAVDHFDRHRFGNATMHDLFASWEQAGAGDLSAFTTHWLRTAGADTLELDRAAGVLRRTPPEDHPADRSHALRVAVATGDRWDLRALTVTGPETPVEVPEGAAVVVDPYEDTWALARPDDVTVRELKRLLPGTDDALLRAGVWNGIRTAFHVAAIDPADVLDLLEAGMPSETSDDAIHYVMPWAVKQVAALSSDPQALSRVHATARAVLDGAEPGATLQLAALQAAVASAPEPEVLRGWLLGDVPTGLEVDLDLRWRILVRLAVLGAVDRDELDRALDAERTAVSTVEHTRALAALPDPEAKAWAWARFTGEVDVPNYELEAAGLGMWQVGQEELTLPYVARYFDELPGTTAVRSGWNLAEGGAAFYPMTHPTSDTVDRARELLGSDDLEPSLRRQVIDRTDDLVRRVAVRERFR